jgi:RNA polymerase sigma-70 factor (ECF subfamily)
MKNLMHGGPMGENEERKRLVSHLTRHQWRILAYIHALVPDPHDAADLLQETCMVVCEKFQEFREGTDFVAWACQIAWWRVRAARQRFARSKVVFHDDVLEAVARTAGTMGPELDDRQQALAHCLARLNPGDRALLLARYEPGSSVGSAARRAGRSVEDAYKALFRMRKLLFDCVTHRLASEARP